MKLSLPLSSPPEKVPSTDRNEKTGTGLAASARDFFDFVENRVAVSGFRRPAARRFEPLLGFRSAA